MKHQTRKILAVLRGLARGSSIAFACKGAGVDPSTFYRCRKKHQRINDLTEAIVASRIQIVEDSLFQACVSDRNVTAMIFFLTNRNPERWSDRRALVNNTNVFNARNQAQAKDEPQETVEQILARIDAMRESMIPPDELEAYRENRRNLFPPGK